VSWSIMAEVTILCVLSYLSGSSSVVPPIVGSLRFVWSFSARSQSFQYA